MLQQGRRRKLTLIDQVYKSEAATNTGNKALSMLLAKYDRIYADPLESVDIYAKQCSVGINVTPAFAPPDIRIIAWAGLCVDSL
jgi:glutaminase